MGVAWVVHDTCACCLWNRKCVIVVCAYTQSVVCADLGVGWGGVHGARFWRSRVVSFDVDEGVRKGYLCEEKDRKTRARGTGSSSRAREIAGRPKATAYAYAGRTATKASQRRVRSTIFRTTPNPNPNGGPPARGGTEGEAARNNVSCVRAAGKPVAVPTLSVICYLLSGRVGGGVTLHRYRAQ